MGKWIARAEVLFREPTETGPPSELTKVTKAPSVSFVSAPSGHIPEIKTDHWLIRRDGRTEEVYSSDPLTQAEALARFGADSAEPVVEQRRPATPEEAAELRTLVNTVADLNAFSDHDRAEALEIALADPETSLECFRALVAELSANDELRV